MGVAVILKYMEVAYLRQGKGGAWGSNQKFFDYRIPFVAYNMNNAFCITGKTAERGLGAWHQEKLLQLHSQQY